MRLTYNAGVPDESQQRVGGPGSREIVGIVSDVKHLDLADDPEPFFYTPYGQIPTMRDMTLAVRSQTDAAALTDLVRREVASLDADVPVFRVHTLDSVLASAASEPGFRTLLLSLFAGLALLLTLVGVYGVIGHSVSQRSAEIGLRMALGASQGEIFRMVMSQGMAPVLVGVAAGLGGSLLVTRSLASLLYAVSVTDALTFVIAPGLLMGTALVACSVPARRALGVDPGLALRGD
jgi:predicted lysophospholipase L1 biosynthesis ABC-type transport system permease subunit